MDSKDRKIRIAGVGVCGAGEASRYMEKTLKEFERLCDFTMIATNNATQAEIELIDKYGFNRYEEAREWGKLQPAIKETLLSKVTEEFHPDWIVALDMDEQFCPEVTREVLEGLAATEEIAWNFMIVNLYNDEKHFAHDAGIKRFWNVRFYKYMPDMDQGFLKRPLHTGIAPTYAYRFAWNAPYYINHRGLMTAEDRARKVERYKTYDPQAKYITKEYYKDLARELRPIPFNRKKLLEQLKADAACQPRNTPKPYAEEVREQKVAQPTPPKNTLLTGSGLFRI